MQVDSRNWKRPGINPFLKPPVGMQPGDILDFRNLTSKTIRKEICVVLSHTHTHTHFLCEVGYTMSGYQTILRIQRGWRRDVHFGISYNWKKRETI